MSHTFELKEITKSFFGSICLLNVSFHVDEGEIVSILGPSGSGKTTLLKIAANLTDEYQGSVILDGEVLGEPSRNVFYIPQTFEQLLPWKTALGNLTFVIQHTKGISRTAAKAEAMELMHKIRMENAVQKYPYQLSGGMKQRIAFARALAMDARVLLLDEPFSAIDAAMRKEMQQIMLDAVSVHKKAILFVTHSIEEAVSISDRILIIKENGVDVLDNRTENMTSRIQKIIERME